MFARTLIVTVALAGSIIAAGTVVADAKKKIADKKYDEAITELETAYKTKPAPDVKKTLADAYLAKADAMMADAAMPPRAKYPGALRAYREVLKYDKDNQKAKSSIATIEDVYKSMGRPIPQ